MRCSAHHRATSSRRSWCLLCRRPRGFISRHRPISPGQPLSDIYSSFPTYWLILLVVLTLDYQGKYRDRELTAERLERQLAEARLDALRNQLNPHFLFNALNSVSSLMYVDAAAADTMIRKLGDLLRVSLNRGRGADIRLRDELNFVQGYLEIERLRVEDRLTVSLEIEDAVLDATVPAFTLQPLVENAVHHAIAPRRGGRVDISAWQDESWLHLAVTDDGPGMPEQLREGLGLANTRARLEHVYGRADPLRIVGLPNGRLRVEIVIPFRRDPPPLVKVDEGTQRANRRRSNGQWVRPTRGI
jgi:two-component system, LytTR family, sensor kinase